MMEWKGRLAGLGLEWLFGCRLLSLEPFGDSESKPMRRPSKDVPLNSGGRVSGHTRAVSDPSQKSDEGLIRYHKVQLHDRRHERHEEAAASVCSLAG